MTPPGWCIPGVAIAQDSAVVPLFNGDWTTPVVQPFSQSAAALLALGCGTGLATSIWDFEEAAGNALDHAGGNDLIPVSSPTQNQDGVGLWIGGGTKKAVEFDNNTFQSMDVANNTILEAGTNSVAVLVVFCSKADNTLNANVIGKFNNDGYKIEVRADGRLRGYCHGVGGDITLASAAGVHNDGAWHCVLLVIDRNTQLMTVYTDCHAPLGPIDISGTGSIADTGTFAVGQIGTGKAQSCQVAYAAVWENAAATGMGQADFNAFWVHGQDPALHNPALTALTTKIHASMMWDRVSAGRVAGWSTNAVVSDQLPIGWNGGLSNANKMGLRCTLTISTLLSESDDFTATWTTSNITPSAATADLNDSPRGFRETQKLTSTAINAYVQHQYVVAASTLYSVAAFVKKHSSQAGTATGKIIAYDITNGAEIDSVAWSDGADDFATNDFKVLTFTTPVGCVSLGMRIQVDTDATSFCAALATAVAGETIIPIYTTGGTSTVASTVFQRVAAAGTLIKGATGERQIVAVSDKSAPEGTGYWGLAQPVAGNGDRNHCYVAASDKCVMRIYNSAGVSTVYVASSGTFDWTVERTFIMQWQSAAPIKAGKYARMFVGGVEEGSYSIGSWASGNTIIRETVGTASDFSGLIATSKIFEHPQTDL